MERLQGPINPCLFGKEHLDAECLEQETTKTLGFSSYEQFVSADHSLSFEEEEAAAGQPRRLTGNQSLEDKMPFLERLQSVGLPRFSPLCELSFQALLSSQQHCKKPWDQNHGNIYTPELMVCSGRFQAPEHPESCLTHEVLEMQHSPVKFHETKGHHQHPHSTCACAADGGSFKCNQERPKPVDRQFYCCGEGKTSKGAIGRPRESGLTISPAAEVNKEKRKRIKRSRSAKNKEEVESQRMTHIAVERNRRRQMNHHLCALRSIIPFSYIQRGDQASIIGGAIDFVKELEQLLQSLQAQKRMRKSELVLDQGASSSISSSTTTVSLNGMFAAASSPTSQCRNTKSEGGGNCTVGIVRGSYEFTGEKKSVVVDVKVRVSQKHVNLKVEYYCPGREGQGQLLKAIVALEDLRLTVLHLNITSLETSVHYSFNLKIEDDCELGSADGIAVAVHQIFSFINGTT